MALVISNSPTYDPFLVIPVFTDRAKAVPLSSPLFYVCLTCIFNELMHDWRHVCVCMCMSVLCLRGGRMFCVAFSASVVSYLFITVHQII